MMKRFLVFSGVAFLGALVLSACGSNGNCNPAAYTNGLVPQSCYTNTTNNPYYGQQNPYYGNQNPYQQNPYGQQPYYAGQQPYYGQVPFQGYYGGSYVFVYGSNPYQYYGCRNVYCY